MKIFGVSDRYKNTTAGKAEKGAVTFPRMTTYGEDSRSGHFSFHFLKGEAGYPGLGLQLSPFLATGGP